MGRRRPGRSSDYVSRSGVGCSFLSSSRVVILFEEYAGVAALEIWAVSGPEHHQRVEKLERRTCRCVKIVDENTFRLSSPAPKLDCFCGDYSIAAIGLKMYLHAGVQGVWHASLRGNNALLKHEDALEQ